MFVVFRLLVLAIVTETLCSCGVGQAIFAKNEEEQEYLVADMAIAPPLLFTGVWPSTSSEKPFSYYAALIKERDAANQTSQETNDILAAMDRCFREPQVKKMPQSEVIANFGVPDQTIQRRDAGFIYVYRIKHAKGQPERWLVHDWFAQATRVK